MTWSEAPVMVRHNAVLRAERTVVLRLGHGARSLATPPHALVRPRAARPACVLSCRHPFRVEDKICTVHMKPGGARTDWLRDHVQVWSVETGADTPAAAPAITTQLLQVCFGAAVSHAICAGAGRIV